MCKVEDTCSSGQFQKDKLQLGKVPGYLLVSKNERKRREGREK